MKKILFTLLLAITITASTSCNEDKDYVKLVNRSHQDIYVFDTYDKEEILPIKQAELGNIVNRYYRSGTYKSYTTYFDIDYDVSDTLFISIVSVDTLKKYSWETVYREAMIMEQFVVPLTREYLRSIDYTIKYYDQE